MHVLLFWWHNQNWRFWFWYYFIRWKSYEDILIGAKSWRIKFDKVDEFIRVYDGTRYYLALKNMPFLIGLDTLQAKKNGIP